MGTSAVVRRALRLIDEGALDNESVDDLAGKLGLGSRHLRRLFLQHVGASPISFAQTRRLHFAKRLLDETTLPITQVALAAGFGSLRRFNTAFLQTYGRAPRELRKQCVDAEVTDDEVTLKLAFRPPYDWDQVCGFLAAHLIPGVEQVSGGAYFRTLRTPNGFALICVRPLLDEDALELRVRGAEPATLFQICLAARRVFDTSADPARTTFALRSDPLLGPHVVKRPGLRIPGEWDPFECAVCAIVSERSNSAARTIVARIVERLGEPIDKTCAGLTRLFPTAKSIASGDLSGLHLPTAPILAVKKLAEAVISGEVDFSESSDNVLQALKAVTGMSKSTAEYVALRALGEPDAFPVGDVALRQVASDTERPLSLQQLEARAEAWRPWRGYAALHLWSASSRTSTF
jgi:AraC family transcriptional regulator of adaptative response / DNA-3-methyladenine glycosylase II